MVLYAFYFIFKNVISSLKKTPSIPKPIVIEIDNTDKPGPSGLQLYIENNDGDGIISSSDSEDSIMESIKDIKSNKCLSRLNSFEAKPIYWSKKRQMLPLALLSSSSIVDPEESFPIMKYNSLKPWPIWNKNFSINSLKLTSVGVNMDKNIIKVEVPEKLSIAEQASGTDLRKTLKCFHCDSRQIIRSQETLYHLALVLILILVLFGITHMVRSLN